MPPEELLENNDQMAIDEYEQAFYVGTYTQKEGHVDGKAKGIHLVLFDSDEGHMKLVNTYEAGINPSYLVVHPTGKSLYCVNETGGRTYEDHGTVTSMKIEDDKSLTIMNNQSTEGIAPCHVSLDQQSTSVLVANYVTGSVTSFPITLEGQLAKAQTVLRYRGIGPHERQNYPHAHNIQPFEGNYIATADLGTDTVRFHNFGRGQLEATDSFISLEPGSGPRHFVMNKSNGVMYILNELNATIASFRHLGDRQFESLQVISALPTRSDGIGHSAAIKLHPNDQYLYVSNRGDFDNIGIYRIDDSGSLSLVTHQSTLGQTPRDFEISPDGNFLIAANQDSDTLISYMIDPATGTLKSPRSLTLMTPTCIDFFPGQAY